MTTSNALAGGRPGGLDLGGVADERDRHRLAAARRLARPAERLVRSGGQPVDVADLEPAPGPGLVDLDRQADALVHGHGQRLGAAHAAEPGGQRDASRAACRRSAGGPLGERLVRALQDPLGPDVDPRPGGHLAVHRQAGPLELAEVLPGGPLADQVGVGDQDPRRPLVGPEDADRLARLDQQRLVVLEAAQLADDRVERGPAARRPAGAAVDDEVVRVLGDLGIEVVHQHPQRRLLLPAAAAELRAAGGADGAGTDQRHRPPRLLRRDRPPRARRSWPAPAAVIDTISVGSARWTWYVRASPAQVPTNTVRPPIETCDGAPLTPPATSQALAS